MKHTLRFQIRRAIKSSLLLAFLLFSILPADATVPKGWSIQARPLNADFSAGARNLVWSGDGKWIAAQGEEGIVIREGSTLQARHFLSREMLGWTQQEEAISLIAFDGSRLGFALTAYDGDGGSFLRGIEWRDAASGRLLANWKDACVANDSQAAYFPDGRHAWRVYYFASARTRRVLLPLRATSAAPDANKQFTKHEWFQFFTPEIYENG